MIVLSGVSLERSVVTDHRNDICKYIIALRRPVERKGFPYSSRNSSKGALLREAEILFFHLARTNSSLESARNAVMEDNILGKRTHETRRRCWAVLHSRYFPTSKNSESFHPIIPLYRKSIPETMRRGALYYHYATSDLFSYEATTELVYSLARRGVKTVAPRDIYMFLNSKLKEHPEVSEWSPQTIRSLVSHYLSALRDFGVLEGKVHKKIHRPYVEENLFLYIATCLRDSGKSPRAILYSRDFRLFLLSEEEVRLMFIEAQHNGRIRFKTSGRIISLELPWRSILEYIETLG